MSNQYPFVRTRADGTREWSIPMLLDYMGVPDTEANREVAAQALLRITQEKYPQAEVVIAHQESDGLHITHAAQYLAERGG